jgi:zinc protease
VIALVARTFGALPMREADFRAYDDQRLRPFTQDTTRRVVRHTGPKDQAMLRVTWPTRDESDPVEAMALKLLERVTRIEMTETLREKLGKAYSPGATSAPSRVWKGYGTFAVAASVDVQDLPATRAAIAEAIADLRDKPIPADLLLRARQPLIEAYDNALKGNAGWLGLVDRAQGDPDELDRFTKARARLLALTPADIAALAQRYLAAGKGVEIVVLPEGVEEPAG